jgi:phosphatidylglycerol lysyltransferase
MGAWWRRLTPFLGVALLGAALLALRHEFQKFTFYELSHSLSALPRSAIALAIVLTIVNYAVLTGYDQLAFVYLRRSFPRWQISMASFVGYALSNTLGFAVVSGTSARYRFYSRWGLTAPELTRLVMFYSGTFWLGLIVLGGWSFVIYPPSGLADVPGHHWALPIGLLLLAVAAAYVIASFVRRGPVSVLGLFEITIPAPRLVAGQLVLSVVDWTIAVAVLWVLIPEPRPPFVETASAFLAAQFVGLISNIPGGLGAFEIGMVKLLGPHAPPLVLLPALIAFRVIYYIMPLMLALIVLLVDESYQRRHVVRRWGNAFGTLTISLAPKVLAAFTFIAGAVLLFSGATPAVTDRLRLLSHFLPLRVVELSHFIGSLVGLGLLLVSQALIRRVDAAWTLAVGGLFVGIAASLLKGLDYEEALLLLSLLVLLVSARQEFDRRAKLFENSFSPVWFTAVLLVVLASVVLGEFAFRKEYSGEFWWRVAFNADESRFLRATLGVAIVLFAFGLRQLLQPAAPSLRLPTDAELREVDAIVRSQLFCSPYLAYLGDKELLWNDDRTAFIMYGVQGRTWVSLHDPVGPPDAVPGLIRRFLELADEVDGIPVFYEVRRDYLHRYADFGLAFAKVGEEAIVPLDSFSLDGGKRKKMRLQYHKLQKDGATFRTIDAADVPPLLAELRAVSDDWLTLKASSEKAFSLGFFDEDYLKRFPVAVLEVNGRIEAFANVWPGPGKVELSVDLMRQRSTAPKNSMEGLFIYLMSWGKAEGYERFNLGMAPLSGLDRTFTASLWVRLASYLYRYGQPFYNFQGLRAFKDKFDPIWEPRYLAYPGGLALPRVLADISALIAGGYRRILMRHGTRAPRLVPSNGAR